MARISLEPHLWPHSLPVYNVLRPLQHFNDTCNVYLLQAEVAIAKAVCGIWTVYILNFDKYALPPREYILQSHRTIPFAKRDMSCL